MAQPSKEQRDASIALLAEWGIDASLVFADSWDGDGYESFKRDAEGRKVLEDGAVARTYAHWPDGFPVDSLFAIRGGFR